MYRYYIDRQYKLPDGTRIVGAGSGGGAEGSTIVAVATKPAQRGGYYHGCGENHANRVGPVSGTANHIAPESLGGCRRRTPRTPIWRYLKTRISETFLTLPSDRS